jgi:hypothetical protein
LHFKTRKHFNDRCWTGDVGQTIDCCIERIRAATTTRRGNSARIPVTLSGLLNEQSPVR